MLATNFALHTYFHDKEIAHSLVVHIQIFPFFAIIGGFCYDRGPAGWLEKCWLEKRCRLDFPRGCRVGVRWLAVGPSGYLKNRQRSTNPTGWHFFFKSKCEVNIQKPTEKDIFWPFLIPLLIIQSSPSRSCGIGEKSSGCLLSTLPEG